MLWSDWDGQTVFEGCPWIEYEVPLLIEFLDSAEVVFLGGSDIFSDSLSIKVESELF